MRFDVDPVAVGQGRRVRHPDPCPCGQHPAFRGDIEDAEKLLACVKKNHGLVYAMFETSVFHDDLYAMEKLYAADVFGRIVYSEGEYCHPHSLGAPALPSYKDWRKNGCPMWYPTHATAYYVGITHGSFLQVCGQGTAPFDKTSTNPTAQATFSIPKSDYSEPAREGFAAS